MNCVVCGSDLVRGVYGKDEIRWECWEQDKHIFECGICKLRFLHPPWTQEEIDRLYHNYFNETDFHGQVQAKRITSYLEKYVKYAHLILEIGCGVGDNISRLRRKFHPKKWIIGIDKDPHVCNGVYSFNFGYEDFKPDVKFDFIYGIQLFEHIQNPRNFICKLLFLLNANGRFLLEIPNTDDPLLTLYKVEEFQKFYNIPHHLFFYNEKNIRLFFENLHVPIKVIRYQKYGILNHLRWLILKRPGNFHPHVPIIDDIYKYILTKIFKISDTLIVIGKKEGKY